MKQHPALHLANAYEQVANAVEFPELALQTAAELRRLHEANQSMLSALQSIADQHNANFVGMAQIVALAAIAEATKE